MLSGNCGIYFYQEKYYLILKVIVLGEAGELDGGEAC